MDRVLSAALCSTCAALRVVILGERGSPPSTEATSTIPATAAAIVAATATRNTVRLGSARATPPRLSRPMAVISRVRAAARASAVRGGVSASNSFTEVRSSMIGLLLELLQGCGIGPAQCVAQSPSSPVQP